MGNTKQAITCDSSAIFGFESASQWTPAGGTVATNTRRMQGSTSLRLQGGAHVEVRSAASCSAGATYDLLAFYVAATSTTSVNSTINVSVQLDSVSRGLTAAVVGVKPVVIPAEGQFTRVELLLPADVQTKLAPAFSDLRIRLVFDAPGASAQDYLIDDLSFRTAVAPPVAGTGTPRSLAFSLNFPVGTDLFQLGLLGQQGLTISDGARIQMVGGGFATSASVGTLATEVGVETQTGTVFSVPQVSLRDRAVVNGDVVTSANVSCGTSTISNNKITCSNGARVTGLARPSVPLTPLQNLSWRVDYLAGTTDVSLEPDTQRTLAPDAYTNLNVKGRAKLTLGTGTYFFDSVTLESQSQLVLVNDFGPVVIYVRDIVIWRTSLSTLGRTGDFLLVVHGTNGFAIETTFDGALVAPNAAVRLGVGNTPSSGSVFGRQVLIDPRVVFSSRPALPLVGAVGSGSGSASGEGAKGTCAKALVESALGASMTPRELQEALLRYCGGSDLGPCETALMAQLNLDYFAAARQLVLGTMTPSKHLAFMLDRERKTAQIHGNESLACQIVNGDPDGDFVPNPRDQCTTTPALTATLHNGCPDPASPNAPPIADILAGMPSVALATDPRCANAPSPVLPSPFGAWRYPSDPSVGKAVWLTREPDTSGCPKWYFVEAKLTDGTIQTVGFAPSEDTNLPWIQRASNIVQFNIRPSDGGARGAWARYSVFTDRYRVRVVNAAGRTSAWSNWFRPGQEGCAAGACSDF